MRQGGISNARRVARGYVYRLGIRAPEHIRIEAIARRMGARVVEGPLDGADAQLVRSGDDVRVIVSDRITDPGARRWAIAHELGHLVLGHPSFPPHLLGGPAPQRPTKNHERDYEAEANTFASELLMPYELVSTWCDASPVDLTIPWRIAHAFTMSILATTIRFAELSPERCAAVFSARHQVSWCAPSPTFTRKIERGRRLDPASVAWDFFKTGRIDDRAQPVPADAWFDTSIDVEIVEHSIASEQFGTVLSLLWIPERVAAPLGMVG
ncbi:MAG: ImmA/IrrE family metallo-endopeptidase [Kofleriaceae bacterium]